MNFKFKSKLKKKIRFLNQNYFKVIPTLFAVEIDRSLRSVSFDT